VIVTYDRLLRAEWTKLRSLRSSSWTMTVMVVASIGLAALIAASDAHSYSTLSAADKATWDPTNESLAGTLIGQIVIGVFGVLAITGEFATGTIRSSIAAAPRRTPLLVAKAIVYGGVALIAGELISLASFFVGQPIIAGSAPHATLGQPGVARAVLFAGVYLALICLLALGIGTVIRHTAAAISAVVAILLVVPAITAALPTSVQNSFGMFLPVQIGGASMGAVVRVPHALSPWAGAGVLTLYAAIALGLAGWSLVRRDV
jgi:ABC-2 type transport system permease protein